MRRFDGMRRIGLVMASLVVLVACSGGEPDNALAASASSEPQVTEAELTEPEAVAAEPEGNTEPGEDSEVAELAQVDDLVFPGEPRYLEALGSPAAEVTIGRIGDVGKTRCR